MELLIPPGHDLPAWAEPLEYGRPVIVEQLPGDAYDHEVQYFAPILAGDQVTSRPGPVPDGGSHRSTGRAPPARNTCTRSLTTPYCRTGRSGGIAW